MQTENSRIEVTTDYDRYQSDVILGDLTEKQYKALGEVVRLSPGYYFTVVRYSGGPSSSATHVKICKDDNDKDYVGLVGNDTAQYYDLEKATEKVVRRVSHRVYRRTVRFE